MGTIKRTQKGVNQQFVGTQSNAVYLVADSDDTTASAVFGG